MKATETSFLKFLKQASQFSIPIYQRTYSWEERQCQQLWDDLLRTGGNDAIAAHFCGSIVYIHEGLHHVSKPASLLVIDGQQRLTTVMLILEALARHLGDSEPIDGFSAKKLRNYYLRNPEESDERYFKLLLTQTDKDTLLAIVQDKNLPADRSLRLDENFHYFQEKIDALADLKTLCQGLDKLVMVDISLDRDHDKPQLIFESMNSTGLELSQADLIRNFLLMDLEPEHQTRLYEDHWRPMEVAFGQEAYGSDFDGFMRHYITLKTGEIPNVRAVYDVFKRYARPKVAAAGIDALVADIHDFATYYCAMALGREPNKALAAVFQDLKALRAGVTYPFLLELYQDYASGLLTTTDFERAIRLIESYVFRRAVCAIPTNSLNKTFATFGRDLRKDRYFESIQAHLLTLPSYRRFPDDEEFRREFSRRDLYKSQRSDYYLRRLEHHDDKTPADLSKCSIEHILPQNENLSGEWREALGPEWQRIRDTWLHTLGNLTLTPYNSEYSDRPFTEKRDMEKGFKESRLYLNAGLGNIDKWDEPAIQKRAERLSARAVVVWAAPSLPADVLDAYRPKVDKGTSYTVEDHQQLAEGMHTRLLFEALRKEVLALDVCATEEFLKLYVVYKAETNFVDVVPQARQLRLSLNMKFHELHDPGGLAKDVTGVGRWGNGDVEVAFSELDQLPYVMGLVRQAFEKQMDSADIDGS